MNENEIKRQLENCDAEIAYKYSQYLNAVSGVERAASRAAVSRKTLMLLIPLIAGFVLAVMCYFFDLALLSILALGLGVFIAVKVSQAAQSHIDTIRNNQQALYNSINNNKDIQA